jgi:hypothetical protein
MAIALTLALFLPACATQSPSLEYLQIGMSDDEAARILSLYLTYLPDTLEHGQATISSCSDAATDVDCDFFIEHQMEACTFGTYVLPNACVGSQSYCFPFLFIPDERRSECPE